MSDEESTHPIDLEALRDSLAARKTLGSSAEAPTSDRETSRLDDPGLLHRQFEHEDETVMAPPSPRRLRSASRHGDTEGTAVTRLDPGLMTKLRSSYAAAMREGLGEPLADPADVEEAPPSVVDPPSLGGTLPGQAITEDLRATFDDEEPPLSAATHAWHRPAVRAPEDEAASLEDGDTQTRLPDDAPPSFGLEAVRATYPEADDPPLPAWTQEEALPSFALEDDEAPASLRTIQALARTAPGPAGIETDSVAAMPPATAVSVDLAPFGEVPAANDIGDDLGEPTFARPRGPSAGPALAADDGFRDDATAIFRQPLPAAARPSEPIEAAPASENMRETAVSLETAARAAFVAAADRAPAPEPFAAIPHAPVSAPYDPGDLAVSSQSEIYEIEAEDLIEDDTGATILGPRARASGAASPGIAASPAAASPPGASPSIAPAPLRRPPPVIVPEPVRAAITLEEEETELLALGRHDELLASWRQRLATLEGPNRKAAILLKIAHVQEETLGDAHEAFATLAEAFEIAPANEDVIVEVDRVGRDTKRIAELADKVRKRLLPAATDERRVPYLSSLVFWYERVLGRGSEVAVFIGEIERHDKQHPLLLRRAAQIAALNGDVKLQREHLLRALDRTVRREEKIVLYLQLANAFEGATDAVRWYEAVLELEPGSPPALSALKRIGKAKEHYGQVQWVLERQIALAPSDAERIEPLVELADLQEAKFLKRDAAADLFEEVLRIQPGHPGALKGLERCYHALRDWPKLAHVLELRAESTFDKKAKTELLERAAEVHESKLGDPAGAVERHRAILGVDPKNRRALTDLARLYERLDDWSNVATYRARLAELATSKRASSQELVKLGDFLNLPDRDPLAAKLQYERAVTVDPTNTAGWEALQRLAAEIGDERRVIECLEQRRRYTEVPRQKAAILVELARLHLANGHDEEAEAAFEDAIRADGSNEPAAVAMLDKYTAEERWQEAAPLCELLVNAAIRDHDDEALFVRLRLATRIAAALGDADRAVTSSIAALEARPRDPGAQADLIAVCSQSTSAVKRARHHLAKIAEEPETLGDETSLKLAHLLKAGGELEAAGALFERSLAHDPENRAIAKELAELYLAHDDYDRAAELKLAMAEGLPDDRRYELMIEAGEIWARRAGDLERAAKVFEDARRLKPRDGWLLHTLVWLYGETSSWADLADVLEDMADVQENDAARAKVLLSLAEVRRDKLEDSTSALALWEQVLDLDRSRLDVFQDVVRVLTDEKSWEELERAYRRMIGRVKDDGDTQLQFLLFQQLGIIYRDRLGDAQRAFDALDAASRLRPEDADVRKIVVELLVVTDDLDNAVARLREAIDKDPHDPEVHAELYELFLRQRFFDKAWCAVNVLARMRDLTEDQRRFLDDYAPMPLADVPGQIVEQAWRSHVFHADLDPALTNLFALLTPAVARLRYGQLRPEQRVGRPFTPNHSRMHEPVRMAFNDASEILAVDAPDLLLGDPKLGLPFAPALAPFGALHVCVPAIEAQAGSLIYLAGKALAAQRPELAARAFFPSPVDLASLVATAMRVSRNEAAKDPASAAADAGLNAVLGQQEREGIRSIVLAAGRLDFDVKRWARAADLSSMRAGLLLAGDVAPAVEAIEAGDGGDGSLTARDRIGELYKFATSDLYTDLRGAIGVAVEG